jgi:hypothetical protein
MLVGFGNKSRSGKDTSCDYLVSEHDFIKVSFASKLYECMYAIQKVLNKPQTKDTKLLQSLADLLKSHYSQSLFVDVTMENINALIEQGESIAVSDVRFANEFEQLRDANFTLIQLNRESRVIDRDPLHQSEVELDNASWDYKIPNNDSIAELYKKIDRVLKLEF